MPIAIMSCTTSSHWSRGRPSPPTDDLGEVTEGVEAAGVRGRTSVEVDQRMAETAATPTERPSVKVDPRWPPLEWRPTTWAKQLRVWSSVGSGTTFGGASRRRGDGDADGLGLRQGRGSTHCVTTRDGRWEEDSACENREPI